jgi:hypothetical protein
MLHKVSELCDKIDSIKAMSDSLRKAKYEEKQPSGQIDAMIETIQADCLLVASDKTKYQKKSSD